MERNAAHDEAGAVHAVVLSGSGSSSTDAFEVGVMKTLLDEGAAHLNGRKIDPAIYSGSGFGAFNAAVMASQAEGRGAWLARAPSRLPEKQDRLPRNPHGKSFRAPHPSEQ